MDPNANLAEQRRLVVRLNRLADLPRMTDSQKADFNAMSRRLAELVEALDGWLSNRGFLPTDWQR